MENRLCVFYMCVGTQTETFNLVRVTTVFGRSFPNQEATMLFNPQPRVLFVDNDEDSREIGVDSSRMP